MMRYVLVILVSVLVAFPAFTQEPAPTKRALPDEAAQKAASKVVGDVYKPDYEKAKTPSQKIDLAKKLLEEGEATKDDPVGRFVLFRIAREIAAQQGDLAVSFDAIGRIAREFEVDKLQMQVDAATTAVKAPKLAKEHQASAAILAPLIDEAIAADRYELAKSFTDLTLTCAREGKDFDRFKQLVARTKEIDEIAAEFENVKEAKVVLETKPTDPDANFAVGNFLCFVKGDWRRGITMLALSDNEEFKGTALLELEAKPDSLKLGDAWWRIAENLEGSAKTQTQAHAGEWYRMALPGLSGLTKARVESKLKDFGDVDVSVPRNSERDREAESAVKRGLDWLVKQQRGDGSWAFDTGPNPGNLKAPMAATGMALLPFLSGGHTHEMGEYKENIAKGIGYLARQMKVSPNGGDMREEGATMYGHGLATIALCDAYARTKDKRLQVAAQKAIDFIVYAQDPVGGGWRYKVHQAGDTSVTGWQIRSLKIAADAKLRVPVRALESANRFLDLVQEDGGSSYGYTHPGSAPGTSAIGLLGRIYLGATKDGASLKRGVSRMASTVPSNSPYNNYYIALLSRESRTSEWGTWRQEMKRQLLNTQERGGSLSGSWFIDDKFLTDKSGHIATSAGRVGFTSLCLVTLTTIAD